MGLAPSLSPTRRRAAGGALMDVSGMVVFTLAILVCLALWLHDDERARDGAPEALPVGASETSASGALLLLTVGVMEAQAESPSEDG